MHHNTIIGRYYRRVLSHELQKLRWLVEHGLGREAHFYTWTPPEESDPSYTYRLGGGIDPHMMVDAGTLALLDTHVHERQHSVVEAIAIIYHLNCSLTPYAHSSPTIPRITSGLNHLGLAIEHASDVDTIIDAERRVLGAGNRSRPSRKISRRGADCAKKLGKGGQQA